MAKYDDLLLKLEDNVIYSAGLIVRFAEELGYTDTWEARLRIRISLNTRARQQGFSPTGDGWVKIEGQGPTPGWCGWRWKSTVVQTGSTSLRPPENPDENRQTMDTEHRP